MGIIGKVKLNLEAFHFGIKTGLELKELYPLTDSKELKVRGLVKWCEHLDSTGRSELIKNRKWFNNARELIKDLDSHRNSNISFN